MLIAGFPVRMRQRHKVLLGLIRQRLEGFEVRQLIREEMRRRSRHLTPVGSDEQFNLFGKGIEE